ncbi:MAG: YwbE family protein [Bacteroidales bacterium]|nr:YwbE family protein [Bacteroidales bacterium]
MVSGQKRSNISIGDLVEIVQKQDQQSGELTEGIVKKFLTKSPSHPHGIKVMLTDGTVGRVKTIIEEED